MAEADVHNRIPDHVPPHAVWDNDFVAFLGEIAKQEVPAVQCEIALLPLGQAIQDLVFALR